MPFKLTGARRTFVFTILIVVMNVMAWGVVFKAFDQIFHLITTVMLSFTVSLYVYLKIGDRIKRRKATEQDARWVKKSAMTMQDWMKKTN